MTSGGIRTGREWKIRKQLRCWKQLGIQRTGRVRVSEEGTVVQGGNRWLVHDPHRLVQGFSLPFCLVCDWPKHFIVEIICPSEVWQEATFFAFLFGLWGLKSCPHVLKNCGKRKTQDIERHRRVLAQDGQDPGFDPQLHSTSKERFSVGAHARLDSFCPHSNNELLLWIYVYS